jgi:protein-L-isoaspartate(D-aspartate) O-methyltransferase
MISEQLLARDITAWRVIEAMARVPRELFVLPEEREEAYEDRPLPIGFGQTISQPYMVALMTQLLQLKGREKILDIGTGSGYQAAILSLLTKTVISIERIPALAARARETLQKLGYTNVEVIFGDGNLGVPCQAPFAGIICAAACPKMPSAWQKQLKEGGRAVFPQKRFDRQILVRLTKTGGRFLEENFGGVIFVPLISGRVN